MLFTQQDFHLCLFFFELLFFTRNCCFLNQISAWCCLLKCFLQKNVMLFCSQQNKKNFPSWVYFCFYPAFHIGTIMTTCGSSIIYSWDKADFRVAGPKRSQPCLPMYIPIVTFSFPDIYEHSKNQLIHSFIHEIEQIIESLWLKATPIFEHIHQ